MKMNLSKTFMIKSLLATILTMNLSFAAEVAESKPKDGDYLKLLDSFKYYNQTPDLELAAGVDSSFYNSDEKTMSELQKNADETLKAYLQNPDVKQSSATKVLVKTLTDAYNALKAKLVIQKAAAAAFDKALQSATKLDKDEKTQEDKCSQGLANALLEGNAVNSVCNSQKNDDDKKYCGDELNACSAKIKSDNQKFKDYLKKRDKLQASKPGFDEVSADAEDMKANFPGSSQVCTRYTQSMAKIELSGNCLAKLANDETNEAYQNPPPKTPDLDIRVDLDSYMLTPKHRAMGWPILKAMADAKIKETEAAMAKVLENVKLLSGIDISEGTSTTVDDTLAPTDDQSVAIYTNNGTTVSLGTIKNFFAKNPSPEEILKTAAGLGLTKDQIAHAMNLAGYGGQPTSDLNNLNQTREAEAKFAAKIDQFVNSSGGNFNGPSGSLQVPGVGLVDSRRNVMSNQGWVTPEMVKKFMDTNPTDQQFFAKMYELGLRNSDVATILNGQNLLFKNGDPTQILYNDSKFGSIFNRLQNELYQGVTGYGVADTYNPHSLIIPGTGHIMDEEKFTWVPYGFKYNTGFNMYNTQTTAPTTFVTGGQFGNIAASAKGTAAIKVIKPEELKKLTTKPMKK